MIKENKNTTKFERFKTNLKKYSGALLATAIVVGGVTSATFDFSKLPGADKIKTGAIIKADDILALSHALDLIR